ncbi:putative GTPase-activating protein [Podospora fimiseda]|uniref:GTPase-activating protein n=1 Tax=Podospora fimiseda TaxID=252190 RepID=A0AAN7BSA1_9PEZI|nr:putative GTPase-activating protein [Podospora fimiseda]
MLGKSRQDAGSGNGSGGSGGAGYPAGTGRMPHHGQHASGSHAKPQWPNAGPWSKHDAADISQEHEQQQHQQPQEQAQSSQAHHPPQHRFFSPQNFSFRSNHSRRPSSSPKPVLNIQLDRQQVPTDLISPRSDSFFYGTNPAQRPNPSPVTPSFYTPYRARAESNPAGRLPPRSAFPGLSSNPFIAEAIEPVVSPVESESAPQPEYEPEPEPQLQPQLEPQPEHEFEHEPEPDRRRFPLLRHDEHCVPPSPASLMRHRFDSPTPTESRRGTPTPSESTIMTAVESVNFSRPRKMSVRSQQSDSALSRRLMHNRTAVEPTLEEPTGTSEYHAYSPNPSPIPWHRRRRLSGSSSQSSSTFSSIRPSNENSHTPARSESSTRPANSAISAISGPYARSVLGPSSQGTQTHARETPGWLGVAEETRSSFRSQFTTSTAQGTMFTAGTERNSVLTKSSSVTEQSIIDGYARASWWHKSVIGGDDGPSLEDVMQMYERGFTDSDIESIRKSIRKSMCIVADDDDMPQFDLDRSGNGVEFSRPETSHSDADAVREKMLEAMNDSLPIPAAPISIATDAGSTTRQSVPKFRQSLMPTNSLPKDFGFGMATEHMEKRKSRQRDSLAKHDSGKLVDGESDPAPTQEDENNPPFPPSPLSQQPSVKDLSPPNPTPMAPIPQALPSEPPEDPSSRDRYGFRKASPNVTRQEYDAWNAGYTDYLSRRRKKWIAFLKDNSLMTDRPMRFPPRSTKTKRFIRKGIPPDWRGAAWFYYAGGPAILAKHRGVYDDLVRRAALDPKGPGRLPGQTGEVKPLIVDDIEKDLYRTFPDNIRFKPPKPQPTVSADGSNPTATLSQPPEAEPEIITALRRVLHAFALFNPRIGYCQSLNFLAGLLLLFVDTEEQAFWLLNVITRVYLPGTHEMSLEGSKVDLGVLMASLKDTLPAVWKQIGGDDADLGLGKKPRGRRGGNGHKAQDSINDPNRLPAITLCMTAWFMSCFIGTLPIESVLRVWDVFFYEGSRTLFRVALTIFKLGEPEIKAVQDPMEMFGVVQQFPRKLVDCNALMELCYFKRLNGIGHLTQNTVETRRQERREGIRKWKEEQEAAAVQSAGLRPATKNRLDNAAGLDLAGNLDDANRKGTMFNRRKDREQVRAAEVM